ncbi:MAG: MBL fold metallo-hydrolase [Pseudonocardiaceae bacterium]|nr:MBL fold metallo-hydrolase [Pseudonocardiaceae bacterium]
MTDRWVEVGQGVLVRRHDELDLSTGLVIGDRGCLVIDTRCDLGQGAELAEAVRALTSLPWQVVITHAHFDHCLGTAALLPATVWAHLGCRDDLAAGGARQHAEARQHGFGAAEQVRPVVPDRVVAQRSELDLGGRQVVLAHLGPGHTDHDLIVAVPDAGVVFAGDLVEQAAPPAFEDAFPLHWPGTVSAMLALDVLTRWPTHSKGPTVVPGHGHPVDRRFVTTQRDELADLAAGCQAVVAGRLDIAGLLRRSPFDAATTRTALHRATAGNPTPCRLRPADETG